MTAAPNVRSLGLHRATSEAEPPGSFPPLAGSEDEPLVVYLGGAGPFEDDDKEAGFGEQGNFGSEKVYMRPDSRNGRRGLVIMAAVMAGVLAAGICIVHAIAPPARQEPPFATERQAVQIVNQKDGFGCPVCTPHQAPKLDVVIPFFERDLCKLKYTVKALGIHDPDHVLGNIFLLWVSEKPSTDYAYDLKAVVDSISSDRQVQLVDFQPLVKSSRVNGWFAQQILKLKIASIIISDFYMVLDAKNTLIQDLRADTLFTGCHQAKLFAEYTYDEIPEPHATWYKAAQNLLNVHGAERQHPNWPASITPFIFHKQTALDLLASVNEEADIGELCSHDETFCRKLGVRSVNASDQNHPTEFTLYVSYAFGKTQLQCAHSVVYMDSDSPDVLSRSLWRGMEETREKTMNDNMEVLENITSGILHPIIFGSQPSALDFMDQETKTQAIEHLKQIYNDAGLYDESTTTIDELVRCAIGTYNFKVGV